MPLSVRAEAWLLDALALDALAEHDDAARSLERSLDLAEPAGLRRLILEHGTAFGPCCAATCATGRRTRRSSARRSRRIEHRGGERSRPVAVLLAEPLSEREQAILRYLPTMMSNQEIAGELFVSVNTVKTHLKAIYRKLDARAGARPCSAAASSGSCRDALAALGQPAHLDQLQAERLQPAQQPVQLGLVADRAMEDRLHRLDFALHRVERLQHGRAHPATDADLIAGIRHRRPPRASLAAGGVSFVTRAG